MVEPAQRVQLCGCSQWFLRQWWWEVLRLHDGWATRSCSIRENQADKLGLYAFDDADDIAIMAAPGLNQDQQREVLEHCEKRVGIDSRFWTDPIVSAQAIWRFQRLRRVTARCMCRGSK